MNTGNTVFLKEIAEDLENVFKAKQKRELVRLSKGRVEQIANLDLELKYTHFLIQTPEHISQHPELKLTDFDTNNGKFKLPEVASHRKYRNWVILLAIIEKHNWRVTWKDMWTEFDEFTNTYHSEQSISCNLTKVCKYVNNIFDLGLHYNCKICTIELQNN